MQSRDWFALGTRLLGVWVLYRSVQDWLHVGISIMGYFPPSMSKFDDSYTALKYDVFFAAGFLAFSLYLLFGAERLTRFAYKSRPHLLPTTPTTRRELSPFFAKLLPLRLLLQVSKDFC